MRRSRMTWTDPQRPPEVGPFASLYWSEGRWWPRLTEDGRGLITEYLAEVSRPAGYLIAVHNKVYHFARRRGLSPEEIDALALEGLCDAAVRFRPGGGASFKTYSLWWVCNAVKKASYVRVGEDECQIRGGDSSKYRAFAPEVEPPDYYVIDAVRSVISRLPTRQQQVIRYAYGVGAEQLENGAAIAKRIGVSREYVRQILNDARQRLSSLHELRRLVQS